MPPRMRLVIAVLVAALVAVGAAPASASTHHRHKHALALQAGRKAMERAVKQDIAENPGATGHVGYCWHRGRRNVACWIRETGVEVWGLDDWDVHLVYSVTAGSRTVLVG